VHPNFQAFIPLLSAHITAFCTFAGTQEIPASVAFLVGPGSGSASVTVTDIPLHLLQHQASLFEEGSQLGSLSQAVSSDSPTLPYRLSLSLSLLPHASAVRNNATVYSRRHPKPQHRYLHTRGPQGLARPFSPVPHYTLQQAASSNRCWNLAS
jgi:hypothetical protein